jgi:hypothetical protein
MFFLGKEVKCSSGIATSRRYSQKVERKREHV